ncbi:MAG: RNA polymerase sigma factor [Acidimicrobiales bacterium]
MAAAARAGDGAALDLLLRRHYPRIFAVCRRLAGNEADALDAAQEALLRIARRLDRFDGRSSFSTWSYRVATNACLDELRRRQRRPTPGLDHLEGGLEGAAAGLGRADPPVDAEVSGRADLTAALAELPLEFRAPVVLRDMLGFDYAEIAEALDLKPGTVRSRIARGRAQLARRLVGNQPAPSERPTPRP